ncbi:alkaline phosphatase family protein [bacterium]|nr:alkaline phosphatase family protein [bacterium]
MAIRCCSWSALPAAALLAVALADDSSRAADPPAEAARPRLVVMVVFDQLRADYLTRWEKQFGDGGFRRLEQDGAWFQNCHYDFAGTWTGAGHASLSTGCSPAKHGIVGNEWYGRAAGKSVYCVAADRYDRVPPAAPSDVKVKDEKKRANGKVSPETLRAVAFADALKNATGGKARVVSLSFKDRAAILLGGKTPDACYWLDTDTGEFVTSTYYRDRLHPWVEAFNRGRPADHWFGKDWTRLRPDLDYDKLAGPDDVSGEGVGIKQGRTFPHPMSGGLKEPGAAYYQALYTSPFGNDLLLALAKEAIDKEELGKGDVPDFLSVSFTSNDPVGHVWGPDSQEVLDTTLRSDLAVKGLLDHLDAKVGKGRYLLVLSADHGVCPLPGISKAQGKEAGRIPAETFTRKADEFLAGEFGGKDEKTPRWVEAVSNEWLFLNQKLLRDRSLDAAKVEEALAGWLKDQPGVLTAYTRTQLTNGTLKGDAIGERAVRSFYADRCGDVMVVLKPYHLIGGEFKTGTTHGSPHPYDTHVPLLVYGAGVKTGVRREELSPAATPAVFAEALGIKPPADAATPAPKDLFEKR